MAKQLQVKNKIEAGKNFKITAFKKDIRKTSPHKHNSYFEIIYLFEGSGVHVIDSRTFKVTTPVIFTVRKEQIHNWELDTEPDGFVLILKKDFIDNSIDKELKSLLMQSSSFPCIYLKEDTLIRHLFEMLLQEYVPETDNNTPIIEGLLKALLAKMLQLAKPITQLTKAKDNLYQKFQELLSQDKTLKNSVAYYAELLHTTPQNLNAVCRKSANQSAAKVLSDFIISEAKRLLLYTDNSVSSISFSLAFNDASHFIKYFKRFTGYTPQSFRLNP